MLYAVLGGMEPRISELFRPSVGTNIVRKCASRSVRAAFHTLTITLVVLSTNAWVPSLSHASDDSNREVLFDTAAVVACQDVSTPEFKTAFPGDQLLEAEIEISSLHRRANREDLEYLVQVYSAARLLQVVDYEPKTTVAPKFDGSISVETTKEGTASIGVDASGAFEHIARITGHANAGGKTVETERFQRLPPHELLLAAGLMHRGSGVYFKVRSSPDSSMEGGRRFTIRFRVPEDWRGGFLTVSCVARSDSQSPLSALDVSSSVGRANFIVAAHVQGDREAKDAAESYARSEYQLRRIATLRREAIRERSHSSTLDRIGSALGMSKPNIPSTWLNDLMNGNVHSWEQYEAHLPRDVRDAANSWMSAKQHLASFNGYDFVVGQR